MGSAGASSKFIKGTSKVDKPLYHPDTQNTNQRSYWVLPPPQKQLDNNYNMVIYIALNRPPNIGCYWVGAVPKILRRFLQVSEDSQSCPKKIAWMLLSQSQVSAIHPRNLDPTDTDSQEFGKCSYKVERLPWNLVSLPPQLPRQLPKP